MKLAHAAAAAGAGALHPARRAADPGRLAAVPRRLRHDHARPLRRGLASPSLARQLGRCSHSLHEPGYRLPVAAGEPQPVEEDAGGDARAAVGDDLAVRELGGSGSSHGALRADGMRPGTTVDRVRLAAEARREARVHEHDAGSSSRALDLAADAVSPVRSAGTNIGRLDLLLAAAERAAPAVEPPTTDGQSSWPKWRSSHHSRSAPPCCRTRPRSTPRSMPRAAGCARERLAARAADAGPPRPARDESSVSTSRKPRRECARRGRRARPAVRVDELPPAVDEAVTHVPDATPREGLHADVTNAHPGDVGPSTSTGRNAP